MKKLIAILLVLIMIFGIFTACGEKAETVQELLTLGEKYLTELDYEMAIVTFNKVIEIEPRNAKAHRSLVEVYIMQDNIDMAKEHLFILKEIYEENSNLEGVSWIESQEIWQEELDNQSQDVEQEYEEEIDGNKDVLDKSSELPAESYEPAVIEAESGITLNQDYVDLLHGTAADVFEYLGYREFNGTSTVRGGPGIGDAVNNIDFYVCGIDNENFAYGGSEMRKDENGRDIIWGADRSKIYADDEIVIVYICFYEQGLSKFFSSPSAVITSDLLNKYFSVAIVPEYIYDEMDRRGYYAAVYYYDGMRFDVEFQKEGDAFIVEYIYMSIGDYYRGYGGRFD